MERFERKTLVVDWATHAITEKAIIYAFQYVVIAPAPPAVIAP